jgi:hypothetical protein
MPIVKGGDSQKWAALAAFIIMGASPSFIDWEQSPEKRRQVIGFYAVSISLFWYGFLR